MYRCALGLDMILISNVAILLLNLLINSNNVYVIGDFLCIIYIMLFLEIVQCREFVQKGNLSEEFVIPGNCTM